MKVLVISLLRIGDFLLTLPTVNGLKKQPGVTRVDVLTFSATARLRPMLDVGHWWTLNRDDLQAGLGRADIPLLTSYSVLKETLDRIDLENYDYIVNLTQTEFSAWVAGYLGARSRAGLVMNPRGEAEFHSPWFRYLNAVEPGADIFHYSDIFYYGAGLDGPARDWTLNESAEGRDEASAFGKRDFIAVQALTSDVKKNWNGWLAMLQILQATKPDHEFVLLGAPSEREHIDALTQAAVAAGVRARAAILSLAGAYSLLQKAKLLITGDTSIKHLANSAGTPTLELCLGSSDPRRTGAYAADALILQPSLDCVPCPQSGACSKATHECAEILSPALVATTAAAHLDQNWERLAALANQPGGKIRFLRALELSNGFWLPRDLSHGRLDDTLNALIERSSWKFLLNGEHRKALAEFGSESLNMKNELGRLFSVSERPTLNAHLDFLETESEKVAVRLEAELESRRNAPVRGVEQGLVSIGERRRELTRIENSVTHARIQVKMIKTLKSQLTESV